MASNLLPRCQAQFYSNPFPHPQFTAPTPSPAEAWAGLKNEGHRTGGASQAWFGEGGHHLRGQPRLLLRPCQWKKLRKCQIAGERAPARGFTICFVSYCSQHAWQDLGFCITAVAAVNMSAWASLPGEHPGLWSNQVATLKIKGGLRISTGGLSPVETASPLIWAWVVLYDGLGSGQL